MLNPESAYIRPADECDAAAILDITREAFTKYQEDLGLVGIIKALSETEDDIVRDINEKYVFVGEFGGEAVGSIRCQIFGDLGYISRFGVKLEAQKHGMGRMLVSAVETKCRELGVKAIALHTSSKMHSLIRFYYGGGYYVHSIDTSRGYLRALLVCELTGEGSRPDGANVDLTPLNGF